MFVFFEKIFLKLFFIAKIGVAQAVLGGAIHVRTLHGEETVVVSKKKNKNSAKIRVFSDFEFFIISILL